MSARYLMYIVIATVVAYSGCIVWDAGYTENQPVFVHETSPADRIPVTYNVSLKFERFDFLAAPDRQELMRKIETALNSTGFFSSVAYGEKGGEDSYHIEFSFHQAGMLEHESEEWAFLSGSTLLLVPCGEIVTLDGIATLSLKGDSIYSTAKAEELRCFVWLPVAPLGLFMNEWSAWHYVEKGLINALVNDITAFHQKRFFNAYNHKISEND